MPRHAPCSKETPSGSGATCDVGTTAYSAAVPNARYDCAPKHGAIPRNDAENDARQLSDGHLLANSELPISSACYRTERKRYALFYTSLIRGAWPLRLRCTISHSPLGRFASTSAKAPMDGGARGRMCAGPPGAGLRSQPGIGQFDGPVGPESQPEPGRQGSRVQSRLAGRQPRQCRSWVAWRRGRWTRRSRIRRW